MQQIIQNLKTGETQLTDVPLPMIRSGCFLIRTSASLISAGTERMLVEFGKANWLEKARQQPEKVKMVMDKIKTDGIMPTIDSIRSKLDQPMPLGYCNAGVILEIKDAENQGYKIGDRIISNGHHAEIVCVPKNLCAKIPNNVSDEDAAFTVIGAIALQGIRLATPALGESFVVTGLGLIGLLAVQIFQAHGCRVLGIDLDPRKCALAREFGAQTVEISKGEDPVTASVTFSKGRGMDGVLITASAQSSEPIHQAAQMCRKRGRIIMVGVTGMELNRSDFYQKELSFQVSCSYGPGRYDPEYEEKGHDYPIGFVRWTEQRNFEAVLDLMASGKLNVKPLITHRFDFEDAPKAYALLSENKEPYLGIVLNYKKQNENHDTSHTVILKKEQSSFAGEKQGAVLGMIGAGNYTRQVLLPAIAKTNARLKIIASASGVSGTDLGKKFGFEQSSTDAESIFRDSEINTVIITTRHNTHASFVLKSLESGKNVFVEKPLCLSLPELNTIIQSYNSIQHSASIPKLMVGFNRRFSPLVIKMKELLSGIQESKSMIMTVNAGLIPKDHWTQDIRVGGGRIIGEACHFIDLLRFLAGNGIEKKEIARLKSDTGDTVTVQLGFSDGSIGTIHYFANGNKSFPKERLEIFSGGKILQLENFRTLKGYGWKNFNNMKLWQQDKGQTEEMKAFIHSISKGEPSPIPFEEIIEVTDVTLKLADTY